jgi:hypothetical protein
MLMQQHWAQALVPEAREIRIGLFVRYSGYGSVLVLTIVLPPIRMLQHPAAHMSATAAGHNLIVSCWL